MDGGEDSLGVAHKSKSSTSPRKLFKRGRSPEERPRSRSGSPSKSRETSLERSSSPYRPAPTSVAAVSASTSEYELVNDESSLDLSLRLELARHNSVTLSQQHSGTSSNYVRSSTLPPVQDTIAEGQFRSSDVPPISANFQSL